MAGISIVIRFLPASRETPGVDSIVSEKVTALMPEPAEPNAAERLAVLAFDDMRRVDALILDRLQSHVTLIPELARYLIEAGGKRTAR